MNREQNTFGNTGCDIPNFSRNTASTPAVKTPK